MLSLLVFSCSLIYPWFSFLPLSSSPLSHSEIRNRTQNVGWQKHGALFFFSIGTAPLWRTNYPTKCFFFFKTKIVVLQQHLLPSRRDGCFCCREAAIFLFLTISKLLQTREVSPVQFLSLPPPPTSTSTSTSTLIFSSPPFPHNKNYMCLTFVGYTKLSFLPSLKNSSLSVPFSN